MRPQPVDDLHPERIGHRRGFGELRLQHRIGVRPLHLAGQAEGEALPGGELEDGAQEVPAGQQPVDGAHVVVEVGHVDTGIERGLQLGGDLGRDVRFGGMLLHRRDVGGEEAVGVDEGRGPSERTPPVPTPLAREHEVHAHVEVRVRGSESERFRGPGAGHHHRRRVDPFAEEESRDRGVRGMAHPEVVGVEDDRPGTGRQSESVGEGGGGGHGVSCRGAVSGWRRLRGRG